MGPVRDTVDGASPPIDDVLRNEWKRCVVEWVENSCRVQGVSTKITDVAILGQVAVLLVAGRQPDVSQTRQSTSKRSGSNRVRPLTAGLTVT